MELESPPGRDYQFQLDQMNANPDASGHRAVVRPDNSNPVHVSAPNLHASIDRNILLAHH